MPKAKVPAPPTVTTIRMPADMHEKLRIYCVMNKTTINAVVNDLLAEMLAYTPRN